MDRTTHEKVLDAAAKLFSEKGLAEVSMQEVAKAGGFDYVEISELFGNMEKLYEAVLETQFSLYTARMDAVFHGEQLPIKKIELFARAMYDVQRESPFFYPLFYRELLNPSPYFESIVKKNVQHVAYLSDNNIAKGIQKGTFKRAVNPANTTMFLAGMFHYYFLASRLAGILLPEPTNDEEYLSQALNIFLSGLKKGG